jgi:molybdopterin molybdotransferase
VLSTADADELIRQHVPALPAESLPLAQAAGSVLRQAVHAERDQPPFDRVSMDGIALDSRTVKPGLRIQGMQAAGDAQISLDDPDACIEVMTGAVLPKGCDAVVPFEEITVRDGTAVLKAGVSVVPWLYIHRRGSDSPAGRALLSPGVRMRGAEMAVAASAGLSRIEVASQPRIAVISTGSELVEPGEPILPHQVRRSNVYALLAALREHGYTRLADEHVRDDEQELTRRLRYHLDTHDVLVLTGGVSMGRLDLVPGTLKALGVREVFHRIAQRPGKPLWFGVARSGTMVFGLPGNPVSTSVCLARYVLPALDLAQGMKPVVPGKMALAGPSEPSQTLTQFVPVTFEVDEESRAWAVLKPTHGSGDFVSLIGTDGFVEIPPGDALPRGTRVTLYRW